jgi:protoporphyrin/coproporphyrin ferrochelatase
MANPGALLVNLGSPASSSEADVRRYLAEFLSDPRVLDLPAPLRWLLLHGVILPRRAKRSAAAYASVWQAEGSPLLVMSRKLERSVAARNKLPLELAMRYGEPSISAALQRLAARGVDRLLVIPLYPHYAMSSYETVVARVRELAQSRTPRLSIRILPPFYEHPEYIEALAASSAPYFAQGYDHLLLSYHGLPVRHLRKADSSRLHCTHFGECCTNPSPAHATCYRAQTLATSRAFARRAGIPEARYSVAYQSRLAGEEWMRPHTDQELVRLAEQGVRRLVVVTPAFVSDCLETLEEIAVSGRRIFLSAGGQDFVHVPCLNDHPSFVAFLQRRIDDFRAEVEQASH